MEIKITEEWVLHHRHPRAENGYKQRFGHVLVIGGSPGFYGSVLLTAEAALRSGCGLVSVLAGDTYAQKKSKASLVASDLIEHLGNTKLLD
jgi:NAD(P)H-hydrate repair Nnr-like enzyme with NAD(P)H-hydrate dehydratase domain